MSERSGEIGSPGSTSDQAPADVTVALNSSVTAK